MSMTRRDFVHGLASASAAGGLLAPVDAVAAPAYSGPNVVVVRFGGGVRRRETIEAATTFAPTLVHVLAKRGVLVPDVTIAQLDGVDTSHAEGTLNLLTGRYRAYRDAGSPLLAQHLEPTEPTLFEVLRRTFDVPSHQAVLVNGEDRPQEELFSYGIHKAHGVGFRSEVLSLYRFKLWRLRAQLAAGRGTDADLAAARKQLAALEKRDYRGAATGQAPAVEALWRQWQAHYGDSGLKNPRGDAALTELALWALRHLRPRLMMVCYQDPDYVHWGNASHYTRAITFIDKGLERLVAAVDADPEYRDRTVVVVVPDCGRDANPLMSVPFQHHFNSRSAHDIWALFLGARIPKGRVLDKPVDQTSIAATVGALMGMRMSRAEGRVLSEVIA